MTDNTREVWEGWTVQNFIDELELTFPYWYKPFKTDEQIKKWCMSEQPYYKKNIPEVTKHFINKYK